MYRSWAYWRYAGPVAQLRVLTTFLPYYLTTLLPYYLTTLLPYHLTTLPPCHLTTLLPRYGGPVAQLRVLLGSEDKATFSAVS